MANLIVEPLWSEVRQLEVNELARGGLNGNMNEQAKALLARIEFIKKFTVNLIAYFGAYGDGTDQSDQIFNALQTGNVYFSEGIYDLGGKTIDINNSVNLTIENKVIFRNGFLRLIPTDNQKRIIINGDLNIGENCSLRMGGLVTPSVIGNSNDPYEYDPASVTVLCNDIRAISQFSGTTSTINISSYNNSRIGNISVICDDDLFDSNNQKKVKSVGSYIANGYDSKIGNIFISGIYTMAVEIDSSSTRAAFSMCRCEIGNIETYKNPDVADQSGQHGLYFHGAFETKIGIVRGKGWGSTISSSADFKFRDNMNCSIDVVDVDRFRITSDSNYIWFDNYARNNTFKRVTAKYFATVVSAGQLENNYFLESDIDQCALSSNNGNERGVIFSGRTIIGGVEGVINVSASVFENARVSWKADLTPDLIGAFFNATESKFYNDVNYRPTIASTTKLNNVVFFKKFNHEPSSAPSVPKNHTSSLNQVDVQGDLLVKTFSGNTHQANWKFVTCASVAPNTQRQPSSKTYKFVSYKDVNYTLLEQ